MLRQSVTSTDPSMLVHEIRKLEQLQRKLGEEANCALEVLHKEVSSQRLGSQETAENIAKLLSEIKDMQVFSSIPEEIVIRDKANLKEEIARLNSQGITIASLERKLENVQKSIDKLVLSFPSGKDSLEVKTQIKKKKIFQYSLSSSANMQNVIWSPCSPLSSHNIVDYKHDNKENNESIPDGATLPGSDTANPPEIDENKRCISSREGGTPTLTQLNSVNIKKMQRMFKTAAEENIRSIRAYVTELKERVAKLQYQKQLLVCQVLELEANETDEIDVMDQSPITWHQIFEDQRKQIVMLWHLCHVSIIHSTQLYSLFRGDPPDQIYMEVELRRLTWLEQHLAELGNASPALLGDEPAGSVSSSIKALKQEREYLAKRVSSKLVNAEERSALYKMGHPSSSITEEVATGKQIVDRPA